MGPVNVNWGEWGSGKNPINQGQDNSAQMRRLLALSPVFRLPATPAAVTVTAEAAVVTEGADVVFTLTATPAPDAPLSVTVAVSEETGDGRDFVAPAWEKTHTVIIPASGTATLTIPTVGDGFDEPEGAVTAAVQSGGGYEVGDPSSATVAVADANAPPPPTAVLTPNGGTTLPEGAGTTFNITLSRPPEADETVTLPLIVGGTAGRSDYRLVCIASAPAGGTCNGLDGANPSITFDGERLNGAYRLSGPLRIEAVEDNTAESDETVILSLGGGAQRTITLRDAPSSVTLSFNLGAFSAGEDNGLVQPTLQVDAAPGRDIAVPLVFTDITARAGAGRRRRPPAPAWTFPSGKPSRATTTPTPTVPPTTAPTGTGC